MGAAAKECRLRFRRAIPSLVAQRPLDSLSTKRRVGIYAGAFDPVHSGHLAFVLQAKQAAQLDEVIFLPERRPRHKPSVEHYAHRTAMIKQALRPYPDLAVLELVDKHFTVYRTLPQLQALYPDAQLVLLIGSDAALGLGDWPGSYSLLKSFEIVIGLRSDADKEILMAAIAAWPILPLSLYSVESYAADVSSRQIRQALRYNQQAKGLLTSVRRYAREQWLYASPASIGFRR